MAYYSIIFASLKTVTQEKVSLGLILFDESRVLCKFSHSKLSGLRLLMSKDAYATVADLIRSLEKRARQSSEKECSSTQDLFSITDATFSKEYFNYLSRYKNNLMTYSAPAANLFRIFVCYQVRNLQLIKSFTVARLLP